MKLYWKMLITFTINKGLVVTDSGNEINNDTALSDYFICNNHNWILRINRKNVRIENKNKDSVKLIYVLYYVYWRYLYQMQLTVFQTIPA